MKNIWKLLMIAMAAIAMIGCQNPNQNTNEGEGSSFKKIYVAGFNGKWAADDGAGDAYQMTTTDGAVYTVEIEATSVNPTPYGIKFTTANGWLEQYCVAAYKTKGATEDILYVNSNVEVDMIEAAKADLEEKDAEDNAKYADNNTKIYMAKQVNVGTKVTITFNLSTLKAKITYADNGKGVNDIYAGDFVPAFNSNIGAVELSEDEDNSTATLKVYTGEFTYNKSKDTWSKDDGVVEFGIAMNADWANKFTGATLTLGTEATLTYNADANNSISGLTEGATYNVKLTATSDVVWTASTVKITISAAE